MAGTDTLSATFAALADPTRRAILARLAQGSATVKELAQPFSMSGPAISKHLRVLERAGLIRQGREAQWRPCQLEAAPLKAVADWTESYRRFWEESFDRLGRYLHELQGNVAVHASATPEEVPAPRPARGAARNVRPTKRVKPPPPARRRKVGKRNRHE